MTLTDPELRGASDPINWRSPAWRIVPYVFAVTTGFQLLRYLYIEPEVIGFDARLYAAAARDWLMGLDPWHTSMLGVYFAAPPTTLVPFAPFALLNPIIVSVVWVVGSLALALAALRSLGVPLWWLLFWPIVDGILIGNPDVAVLALVVLGRGRLSTMAVFLKLYAIGPIIGERRLGQVGLTLIALALTAPMLPWGMWFGQLAFITENLEAVSPTTSVYGNLGAMVLAGVALLSLGLRRAAWLAVPALWPHTQVHYLALSTPALSPLLAIAWSFPHPAVVLLSLVAEALRVRGYFAPAARWLSERSHRNVPIEPTDHSTRSEVLHP